MGEIRFDPPPTGPLDVLLLCRCTSTGTEEARVVMGEQLVLLNRVIKGLCPKNLGDSPHPVLTLTEVLLQRQPGKEGKGKEGKGKGAKNGEVVISALLMMREGVYMHSTLCVRFLGGQSAMQRFVSAVHVFAGDQETATRVSKLHAAVVVV